MDLVQQLLVYVTLGAAVLYLVWKFFLPSALKRSGKSSAGSCDTHCDCH